VSQYSGGAKAPSIYGKSPVVQFELDFEKTKDHNKITNSNPRPSIFDQPSTLDK
jgi:hypothetical protein